MLVPLLLHHKTWKGFYAKDLVMNLAWAKCTLETKVS